MTNGEQSDENCTLETANNSKNSNSNNNNNNNNNNSKSDQAATDKSKEQQANPISLPAINQQLQQQQQQLQAANGRPLPAPRQQPSTRRPVRANKLRRQAVLVAAATGVQPQVAGSNMPREATNIELAGVIPRSMLPPKRPAHLPARYEAGIYRTPIATGASAANKPNRYLWAHWPPPPPPPPPGATGPHSSQVGQVGLPGQSDRTAAAHLQHSHTHPHHDHHHGGFHHHFAAPFSSAASRVMVVNPMQIVNLSEHTKSRLIKFIEAIKRFSEKWFSHVLLLLFLAVYACLGAYVFISFEAPTEQWEKQLIIDSRQRMVNESFNEANSKNREQFNELFISKLEDYERLLARACASGMSSSSLENQWTFWGALFYSMTVFTTIGYGHLTPITFAGRVATMIYAIFGIPILLMVLADLGKLLTRIIKYAFKKFRYLFNKLLRKKSSLKTRKMISDNTNQYIGVARGAFERGVAYIQPQYNRIPGAFRSSTLSRRFHRKAEQPQVALDTDNNIATSGDITSIAGQEQQQQQQPDEKDQQQVDKGGDIRVTDVIVTPNKQTKPVSPARPENEKRPSQQQVVDSNNNNHGGSGHHQHHSQQHHHHSSNHHNHHGSHGNRGQSPGAQSRRKTSSTFSAATLSKRGAKCSVSRSSSSSQMVVGSTGGLERKPKRVTGQVSGDLMLSANSVASEQPAQPATMADEDSLTGACKVSLPLASEAALESGKIGAISDSGTTGIAAAAAAAACGETNELLSGEDEELEELDMTEDINDEDDEDEDEDEFDIPVSFALFLLVTYMMFGAVVFSIWEGWNFFDSLYFVFISMSTIGFGDLVPQHPKRMIGTFIYLLFGLALTSMCINVVQEKIHATFLRAKLQIGEKMGLDLEQIMADDYYNDGSIGFEGDEDDSNSVAFSQTNSSLAQVVCSADQDLLDQVDCQQLSKLATLESEGVKVSKSKDSLKSMSKSRRLVTGLPGHNSHNNSLRRKPSKRGQAQRQTTPASGGSSMSSPSNEQVPPTGVQPPSSGPPPINQQQQQVALSNQPQKVQTEIVQEKLIGIHHPVGESLDLKRFEEPQTSAAMFKKPSTEQQVNGQQQQVEKHKLTPNSAGQVKTTGHSAVAKSLSSDARFNQQQQQQQEMNKRAGARYGHIARSADSSLRSSVSFELNQLDDLIVALSQSPSERFGPLLGIPMSTRTSCSSSPSTSLARRRATSMINKPGKMRNNLDKSPTPTFARGANKSDDNDNNNNDSLAIVKHGTAAAALLNIGPPPGNLAADSQRRVHDGLERVKFSAV